MRMRVIFHHCSRLILTEKPKNRVMRHLIKKTLLAVAFAIGCTGMAFAQQLPPLPMDPNVRIGKLENGLTYYIRHNEKPENRVEFYIAQKVGSILEEPEQRGLAHFLEHMAFNGTKNFPGDERGLGIVQWCETKGIKFGTNLNAYTSVDETVYNISNVPSTDQAVIDSCLLILHDWSNAVLLADKEIDKERGVIHEEWRSRNVGMIRLYTDAQATFYPNSKYADCMPIGSIDVIDNFPYQAIRDYYAKWYRPDLQGIIIVGDIDVDQIEQKIKSLFSDIKLPADRAERLFDLAENIGDRLWAKYRKGVRSYGRAWQNFCNNNKQLVAKVRSDLAAVVGQKRGVLRLRRSDPPARRWAPPPEHPAADPQQDADHAEQQPGRASHGRKGRGEEPFRGVGGRADEEVGGTRRQADRRAREEPHEENARQRQGHGRDARVVGLRGFGDLVRAG